MAEGQSASGTQIGRSRTALTLLVAGLALLGAQCPLPLPALLASDPPDQATAVAPSEWFTLRFANAVPPESRSLVLLFCDGAAKGASVHALESDTLVVNPSGSLPSDADCSLIVPTEEGPAHLGFTTAPTGSPFAPVHDRRDRNVPLPFPDDFFLAPDASTATGLRLDPFFPDHSTSVAGLLRAMSATLADADGWSPLGPISVELSSAPDPASLPLTQEASLDPLASIGLFDLTPASSTFGERIPFKLTVRADQIEPQPVAHVLILFPGIPLSPAGTYGFVVTRRVRGLDGEPLAPSAFFNEVLEGGSSDAAVLRARTSTLEVLEALEGIAPVPIPRDDVALAVRLTTRTLEDLPDDILALREDVLDAGVNYEITSVEPLGGSVAALVRGTFDVPDWRNGAFLTRDESGVPSVIGTDSLGFVLALPLSAESEPAPIVMYQHGNPGSAEEEVPGNFLTAEGFAVGGFTDVLNRDFPDVATQSLGIFGVLLGTGRVPEFWLQIHAEQIAFLHVLQNLGALDVLPLGAPDGVPDLDPASIVYEGISYGSNHGQAFLAYAPDILAASLVVGAQRFGEIVEYQDRTTPDGGDPFLTVQLPPFLPGVRPPDVFLGLSLYQMVSDPQDPQNHAALLYRRPLDIDGTTKKASVLVLEGIGDTLTKNNTTRSLAWQLGPVPHLPPLAVPVSYLPVAGSSVVANVDAETSAAFVQFVPAGVPGVPHTPGCEFQFEGHFCAQTAPAARGLRAEFYRSAVEDAVPVIGPVALP
jgi:hypothetical protein